MGNTNRGRTSGPYDIFISYRREGGDALAGRIRDSLVERGYRAFIDVESLRGGDFNEQLLSVIGSTPNFVLICTPGALGRCANEGDWVRREIAHALACGARVIPVLVPGFVFPETLPSDIDAVRYMDGPEAASRYYDAFVDRLCEYLTGAKPRRKKSAIAMALATLRGALSDRLAPTRGGIPRASARGVDRRRALPHGGACRRYDDFDLMR